jgi:hypothetical protein
VTAVSPPEPPRAWNDAMVLVYPNGGFARFDPRGRFYRAGDLINGYVVDRFELDGETVVAVLHVR